MSLGRASDIILLSRTNVATKPVVQALLEYKPKFHSWRDISSV